MLEILGVMRLSRSCFSAIFEVSDLKQTYLQAAGTPLKAIRELLALYRFAGRDLDKRVADIVSSTRSGIEEMEIFSGQSIVGKMLLEIGPGQTKPFYYALGPQNDYTAIDLEIAPEGLSFNEFLRIFRENGMLRAVKSLGRQALGIDRKLGNALRAEFGGAPKGLFVQGDASKTDFDDDTFDYVMSISVFEHLQDPIAVMNEITRTLKPGGTVFTVTHLYTSITGAHDPRLFVDIEALPPWAHLDPDHQSRVAPNSYLNRLRVSDYLELFEQGWPGATHRIVGGLHDKKRALMAQLPHLVREEYSEEELLSDVIISLWMKPMPAQ